MIRLFINKYIDKNPERQKELDYCFEKHESNGLLGEIHQTYERLSYNDFFRWINTIVGDEDISIIANSDIYFDETLIDIIKIDHDECYALSRWDAKEDGSIELWDHRDSQGVWIFKGKIKEVLGADFSQGIPGCDNSIAYLLNAAGYKVLNPSKTIRAIHVHNSGIRNYEQHDVYVSLGVHQKSMEGALRFMTQHSSGECRMINWVAAGDCNARIIETLKDFKPDVTFMQLQSGGIITNDTLKSIPVVLTLKTPYRDGTTHLVMSPLEFMQRLAALVPRPRLHLIRFHGVARTQRQAASQDRYA